EGRRGGPVLVAGDDLGIELAAGRGLAIAGRRHAIRRVQQGEVPLEGDAYRGVERERGGAGGRGYSLLRPRLLGRLRGFLEHRLGRDRRDLRRHRRLLGGSGGGSEEEEAHQDRGFASFHVSRQVSQGPGSRQITPVCGPASGAARLKLLSETRSR